MLVSAVIPCYNAQSTIGRAIDSLLQQTHALDQLILVNDGSTDSTLETLKRYQVSCDKIMIIDQVNQGVCVARNKAIKAASGRFILTLDDDDFFEPTFVEKALAKFAQDDQYGAVMCGYTRIVNGKKVLPYIPNEISLEYCLLNNGALSCLLFKREALLKAGLYDPNMKDGYEDWDLNIRILQLGYRFGVVREVLFNYTDSPDSRNDAAVAKDVALRMQLFHKYREDYDRFNEYFFTAFIKENNRLQKENQRIKNSTSFKWSHSIITVVEKIKNIFKSN
jgi:glycosyltransferase involved in cell wall biosynthesis